jgi:hypothetical protein
MDPKTKLFEELRDNGFKLARKRNHLVFQNDAGLEWIVPNTPSDSRAYQNNLADFRLFLQRGTARGKFGDKPVSPREREHFERSLRPVLEKKAKEARERSLGIPREKFERMKMTRAGTAASLAPSCDRSAHRSGKGTKRSRCRGGVEILRPRSRLLHL